MEGQRRVQSVGFGQVIQPFRVARWRLGGGAGHFTPSLQSWGMTWLMQPIAAARPLEPRVPSWGGDGGSRATWVEYRRRHHHIFVPSTKVKSCTRPIGQRSSRLVATEKKTLSPCAISFFSEGSHCHPGLATVRFRAWPKANPPLQTARQSNRTNDPHRRR